MKILNEIYLLLVVHKC